MMDLPCAARIGRKAEKRPASRTRKSLQPHVLNLSPRAAARSASHP